jgi:tRNA A37 threonylcarbamoyladenosine synthetase subunit TsaC/SUA5/YrdC
MTRDAHADRAYEVLCEGGLVLLPTDVGYGLVALGDEAIDRIYRLKGRPAQKPCVTVGTAEVLADVAVLGDERLRPWIEQIVERTPIAIINAMRPESALLARFTPFARVQATHAGTIATFHNAGRLVTTLAERMYQDGRVIVGSSANIAFTGNNYRLADVPHEIRAAVDLVIDDGDARFRNPDKLATTILDLTTYEFRRIGINHAMIEASWNAFRHDVLAHAS